MKLRDSLLFVGEFVGLNKSPDFKLHASSERFLSDAVAQENRVHRNSLHIFIGNDMDYCGPLHSRSQSTSAYSPVSREPDCYRRMSEPAVHGFPSGSYRKISTMSSEEQDRRSEASSRRSSSGSSTFFGSIAAYSNHLNPLTTRL